MTSILDPVTESEGRRRTQAERRDESQRQLLAATLSVVAERGVGAATFDAIGQAAGYSRGLATQRFGSKQGLIDAVIAAAHQARDAALDADHVAEMDPLDAVLHYADSHLAALEAVGDSRAYFMLLAGAVADCTPQREAFAESHERVRLWLAERVEAGRRSGQIRADIDADGVALLVGSTLLGASMQAIVDPQTPLVLIRRTLRMMLVESLRPRQEAADG